MSKGEKNITIQDIAESLKISASTVSRALKNHKKISQATKEKVWAVAKDLGYLPNIPVYMQKQKSNIVLLLVDDLNHPINLKTIHVINNELITRGYSAVIKLIGIEDTKNDSFVNVVENIDAIGAISLLVNEQTADCEYQILEKLKIPLVAINKSQSDIPNVNVIPDIYNGTYLAVNHLIKRGVNSIKLIIGEAENSLYNDMRDGFKSVINSKIERDMLVSNLRREDLNFEFEKLVKEKRMPDSFITCNGTIAQQLQSFLESQHINIPNEVMIVSFGIEHIPGVTLPQISSIEYSTSHIAEVAVNELVNLIKTKPVKNSLLVEPVKLIIKASSLKL